MKKLTRAYKFFLLLILSITSGFVFVKVAMADDWQLVNNKDYVHSYYTPFGVYSDTLYIKPGEEVKVFVPILDRFRYSINSGSYLQEFYNVTGGYVILSELPDVPGEYTLKYNIMIGASVVADANVSLIVVPPPIETFTQSGTQNRLVGWKNTSSIQKPVLLVEGFDPVNVNDPSFYYHRGKAYIETLKDLGHSVFVLDFGDGGAELRDNSAVVRYPEIMLF